MKKPSEKLIALIEAVYDLEPQDAAWIQNLLAVAAPSFEGSLAVGAATYTRDPAGADMLVHHKFLLGGPPDLQARIDRAAGEWPRDVYVELMRPGLVSTLSDIAAEHPEMLEAYERHVPGVRDVFGITAVDPNGLGLLFIALLPEQTKLKGRERTLWQMIGAHLAAGHRLRRALSYARPATELPHNAEAVFDPSRGRLAEAVGDAEHDDAAKALRDAAIQIDSARGETRSSDPATAVEMWKCLTDGRWSLVDWFDSDGRRFMLALPNAPNITDPRGLSNRESVVATYAMHGDSVTLIAYRLGISKAVVSAALKNAMRKLGVRTQAQLIERFAAFEAPA